MTATTHDLPGLALHLVLQNLLTDHTAKEALYQAQLQGISFITFIVTNNIVTSEAIVLSCVKHFGLTYFDLTQYEYNHLLSLDLIRRYRVIPIEKNQGCLHLGLADPMDQQALDAITFHTGLRIAPMIIAENQLNNFIKHHCHQPVSKKSLELSLLQDITLDDSPHTLNEQSVDYSEPLIKFVDYVIQHAIQQSASDIHIEPYDRSCRIRYRCDGVLYEISSIPIELASRFITRLKVMAKLDIAERRLPQDGRFQLHGIDIRINTCPTLFGEKIVLRLLDSNKISLNLDALGFNTIQQNLFIQKISEPHGLILVTGPTGCGKTVTLYSALHYLNSHQKNISTVEDPVEIQLDGINQVNIHNKIGLDFATILRALLRQDPDILMVGEIRDKETANIAIQAAHTGHLVLSTLHTNSAVEAIARLKSMAIPNYNIASSVSLIIAQRLVRKLCIHCKQPESLPFSIGNFCNSSNPIYKAIGCQQCLDGFYGRTGIYEILPFTKNIIEKILAGTELTLDHDESLYQAGIAKVLTGITSLSEINRVLIH